MRGNAMQGHGPHPKNPQEKRQGRNVNVEQKVGDETYEGMQSQINKNMFHDAIFWHSNHRNWRFPEIPSKNELSSNDSDFYPPKME